LQADFLDAHDRHWKDAELLYVGERWANADHLYGLAAECGLKRLMRLFGMRFEEAGNRPANREDRVHADSIWERYESYRSGHQLGARFALLTDNPFADWEVSQRYAHQNNFDENLASAHQRGATLVCELIKKAMLDGLL